MGMTILNDQPAFIDTDREAVTVQNQRLALPFPPLALRLAGLKGLQPIAAPLGPFRAVIL